MAVFSQEKLPASTTGVPFVMRGNASAGIDVSANWFLTLEGAGANRVLAWRDRRAVS